MAESLGHGPYAEFALLLIISAVAVERQGRPAGQPGIIIFGLGRYGARLMGQLRNAGIEVMGVDFDPETIRALHKLRQPVRYGDGEDPSFLESLPLPHAASPRRSPSRTCVGAMRSRPPYG